MFYCLIVFSAGIEDCAFKISENAYCTKVGVPLEVFKMQCFSWSLLSSGISAMDLRKYQVMLVPVSEISALSLSHRICSAPSPPTSWQLLRHPHSQLPKASSAYPSFSPLGQKNKLHKWSCWRTQMGNHWTQTSFFLVKKSPFKTLQHHRPGNEAVKKGDP